MFECEGLTELPGELSDAGGRNLFARQANHGPVSPVLRTLLLIFPYKDGRHQEGRP